ncbi:hypothetical protein ACA373_14130 [Erwinia sp. STN24]|uniref:hypothetical protein n=1 Tax=Erwinia sp. STN24 TaxID=3233996 RepID=UPI00351FA32B
MSLTLAHTFDERWILAEARSYNYQAICNRRLIMAVMRFRAAGNAIEHTSVKRPDEDLRCSKAQALKRAYEGAVPHAPGHGISEERALEISQQFVDLYENKEKRRRGFKLA